MGAEQDRLGHRGPPRVGDRTIGGPDDDIAANPWRQWGPFVSEREWGTVREDYSADGEAWRSVTHDEARSRAYRWGEDGLAAVCDRRQGVCVGLALWNGRDPILKERLFGLTGKEGNHGEDVKECCWYLDATPTHSWLRWRYHYPVAAFPYEDLVTTNSARGYDEREYELVDTGVFDQGFWAVEATWAKASPSDLCLRIRTTNHSPAPATLHVLPTVWLRNVWAWGGGKARPQLRGHAHAEGHAIVVDHERLGRWVAVSDGPGETLFCENETDTAGLYGAPPVTPYPKNGINDHVVGGASTVNPERTGTKAAWWHRVEAPAGGTVELRVRFCRLGDEPARPRLASMLDGPQFTGGRVTEAVEEEDEGTVDEGTVDEGTGTDAGAKAPDASSDASAPVEVAPDALDEALDHIAIGDHGLPDLGAGFDAVLAAREAEADELYAELTPEGTPPAEAAVLRQALAGLLWTQQFYRYDVRRWLDGDPAGPPPPPGRGAVRNGHWHHLDANDVIVMPDKWEYPWFASWDLAFHCVALAHVDPELAKQQLLLLLRVWYLHPNGAIPAYEWEFSDANPPVHAWAALRVFEIDGSRDRTFLERIFQKLLLNFTWWVNREDEEGNNAFEGGFLGLDNIGPFNRSAALPFEGTLEQSDGTGWMAMYTLNMLELALLLAEENHVYEDLAVKFFEHFGLIAGAMGETGFWSEEDGFFYDIVRLGDGSVVPLRIRSMVGVVPAVALTVIPDAQVVALPTFLERIRWFITHNPTASGYFGRYLPDEHRAIGMLSVISPERLRRIMTTLLDEEQFLSPHGLRSLSRWHRDHPVDVALGGVRAEVHYEPAESTSGLFGGNSNWRGPVWMPLNFLVIEKLRRFHEFVGDDFTVELPTGSGRMASLAEVADELGARIISLFLPGDDGRPPSMGGSGRPAGPGWDDPWFFEYFDGDDGRGLGANHQTGWTALVADLILSRRR